MREHLGSVVTTITVSDQNTLRLTLTEANHIYIEAIEGWNYRGVRRAYTAHSIFDGRDWVVQPGVESYAPELSSKGKDIVDAKVLSALNAAVLRVPWFDGLRWEAEAVRANNDIVRLEESITRLEKELLEALSLRKASELAESNAKLGTIPPFYTKPSR